jgi:biotin carboxyl carrier protein
MRAVSETLDRKGTLLTRPMERLLADPHLLSGWLSINRKNFQIQDGKLVWLRNPLVILEETYEYLHMNWRETAPAAEVIWPHDRDLLQNALSFYAELRSRFGLEKEEYAKLTQILGKDRPQGGFDKETWEKIQQAHLGFEVGNELFGMLFLIADKTNFFEFRVEDNLEVTIPDYLNDPDLQATMKKVLVPPPATKADEIVTPGGGMFYAQEAPGMPAFVREGEHFEKGQPLFILEVMKMFNKIPAPFSGTIDKLLIEGGDGVIVQKGQPIFKVTPDEKFVEVDPKEVERQKRATTVEYLERII